MGAMNFFYGTAVGRGVLKALLCIGLPEAMAAFLRSPLSKPLIEKYIRKHNIDMSAFVPEKYGSFADFFIRRKTETGFDGNPAHLISPCDSLLSVYTINEDSAFEIKGSSYKVTDLTGDNELAECFNGGSCLIFRLQAQDYHRFCFVDNGYIHKNRFFEGQLHSVQPIACAHYPVYRINRRVCSVLDTDSFGTVAQIEIGAMAVGGIVIVRENCRIEKGAEMGRFELCGSTIVMLFEKNRIKLRKELTGDDETRVSCGEHIGYALK